MTSGGIRSAIDWTCVASRIGKHTKDGELRPWERGCFGLAAMLEPAGWYGGRHVDLW